MTLRYPIRHREVFDINRFNAHLLKTDTPVSISLADEHQHTYLPRHLSNKLTIPYLLTKDEIMNKNSC